MGLQGSIGRILDKMQSTATHRQVYRDLTAEIAQKPEIIKPVQRSAALRKLEGKIEMPASVNQRRVPGLVRMLLEVNGLEDPKWIIENTTPKGEKLGKWLAKSHIPEKMISETFNSVAKSTVEITCGYNAIMNMADGKGYSSCLGNNSDYYNQAQRFLYLRDKYMALVVIRDKAGKFLYRRIIRELRTGKEGAGETLFGLGRMYGNGPMLSELKAAIEKQHKVKCIPCTGVGTRISFAYRPEPYNREELAKFYKYDDANVDIHCYDSKWNKAMFPIESEEPGI